MISAQALADQGLMTATGWMRDAKEFVEDNFSDYPATARATLIAALVNSAALDETAMHHRGLVTSMGDLRDSLDKLVELAGDLAP